MRNEGEEIGQSSFGGQDVREPAGRWFLARKRIFGGFRRSIDTLRTLREIFFGGLRPRPGKVFDFVALRVQGVGLPFFFSRKFSRVLLY